MSTPMHHAENLFRRIQHVLQFGRTTTATDDSGNVQKVQMKTSNISTRDAVPVVYHYGFTANLPVGSDMVVVHVSGDSSNGVTVATGHQASRPKGLKPGQVMIYDLTGSQVLLDGQGGIALTPSGGTVTIDGKLVVTQDATIGGIDFLPHEHSNGNTGGPTGAPIAGT